MKLNYWKWIKLLQTPFPLGFNDNIYHEGNISKMLDSGVFSLLEIRKRKSRSHGIRNNGNDKRKKGAVKRSNTSLKDLSKVLKDHGRHSMLSCLSSIPISVLRILDTIGITNCTMLHFWLDVILNMLSVHLSILKQITNGIYENFFHK